MNKNRIKVQFFDDEIQYLVLFRDTLEGIRTSGKQILAMTNRKMQLQQLTKLQQEMAEQVNDMRQRILEVRKLVNAINDDSKIQEAVMFGSHQLKIQELNKKLIAAEECVQRAEESKRKLDGQTQSHKGKNFKKTTEQEVVHKFIATQGKVVKEFMRSIELMVKVNKTREDHNKTRQEEKVTRMVRLLKMRQAQIPYCQMRRMEDDAHRGTARSEDKRRLCHRTRDDLLQASTRRKEPLMMLLLRSPSIPYTMERMLALQSLINRTRSQKQKLKMVNKCLSASIAKWNRAEVLRYLSEKQELTGEESIMKIELLFQKLNQSVDERLLSLQYNRSCKSFTPGLSPPPNHTHKRVKSAEKPSPKTRTKNQSRVRGCGTVQWKQGESNPKTNDSFTNAHILHYAD